MVRPYIHIAATVVTLNAVASLSAPIIRRDEQLPTTSSLLRQSSLGDSKRSTASSSRYFSVSGSEYESMSESSSPTSSSSSSPQFRPPHDGPSWDAWEKDMRASAGHNMSPDDNRPGPSSPYPQNLLPNGHQIHTSPNSSPPHPRPNGHQIHTSPSSSPPHPLSDGHKYSPVLSPIRTPKIRFAEEIATFSSPPNSPKSPHVQKTMWQKHRNRIGVGLGLAGISTLVALGATSRRDIDEREDLLYGRAHMFTLDKLE
jgi:hypothetical protein